MLGLGINDLFIIQGVEKLAFFIKERNRTSLLSLLLRANYEWALLHIGIGGAEFFDLDCKAYNKLLLRVWIKLLWHFISEYNISLLKGSSDLKLKREEDQFLIEVFSA